MYCRNIPNVITVFRMILVLPLLICILTDRFETALYLFFIAGVSDGVDGFLARYYGWTSHFGALMDPLADKLLMMTTFSALAWLNIIPMSLFLVVIMRDVIIISGVAGVLYINEKVVFEPSWVSKVNTVMQLLLIGAILTEKSIYQFPPLFIQGLITIVILTTVISLVGYIIEGIRQVLAKRR